MLSTSNALFMADIADGSLFSGPTNTGAIYRVMAVSPGDYNYDGIVNAADYVVWRKNPGSFPADAYEDWRAHFGQTATGSGSGAIVNAVISEPTTLVLLIVGTASAVIRRRRAVAQIPNSFTLRQLN